MIKTKKELHEFLTYESKFYIKGGTYENFKLWLGKNPQYLIWHYQKLLRVTEYYYNSGKKIRYFIHRRQKNKLGALLGIHIEHNVFDKGLIIYHFGSIIVNKNARVGKNCRLHGENCIGNKGINDEAHAPFIGDDCDLGIGAKVIGNVVLGNGITVGANAVVTKSFKDDYITLVGIPASILNNNYK